MVLARAPMRSRSRAKTVAKATKAGLRGGVVGLAGVPVQPRFRGGVDDSGVESCSVRLYCSRQYAAAKRGRGKLPFRTTLTTVSHSCSDMLKEHAIPQDAGVVDKDVQATEGLDRLRYQRLGHAIGNVGAVDGGLAAAGPDLLGDALSRRQIRSLSSTIASEVIDHDCGALSGQQQRMLPTDPPAGSGDDGDLAFQQPHVTTPSAI